MQAIIANEFVVLASIFLFVVLGVVGVATALRRDPAEKRFRGATASGNATVEDVSIFHGDNRSNFLKLIEPFQKKIAQSDKKQVSAAKARLIEAGYYRPAAVEIYFSSRILLGIGLAVVAGLYLYFIATHITGNRALFTVLGAAAFGYYLPALLVQIRIDRRREAFKLGMPDALDMMLVGVEAGLSLPAAMQHIVDEFSNTHPIIAEQFQIVILEFRAGRGRAEALSGMARRMNLQETRTLSSMITQSETLGTSMAQTLRVMSDELRIQRMLDAEKRASELPVKMSVPLVLCIFPSLMAVALVPAVINSTSFFSTVTG